MSIFIAPSIVLDADQSAALAYPAILWDNLVTAAGIAADHADSDYPASNLANPQTSSVWKSGSTASQSIVFTVDPATPVDGIGIARHNFGSGAIGVTISGKTGDAGATYQTLLELSPGDDSPILAIVDGGYYVGIEISLAPASVAPQAAVVYVGSLLRMSKGLVPGFSPPADGLQTGMLSGFAENGDFLGDIVTSQKHSSSFTLRPQAGDWYRDNVRPFLAARTPFFMAWAPTRFPTEASFGKFDGDPTAVLNYYRDLFDVSFKMTGLAL